LSKARRAGVDLKAPKKGTTSEATRKKAAKDSAAGQHKAAAKSTSSESKTKRARRHYGAQARKRTGRIERGAVEADEDRSRSPAGRQPFSGGEEGGQHQGRCRTIGSGEKDRSY
jgi:phage repressor protein C with HTH and peptisase S24 domain